MRSLDRIPFAMPASVPATTDDTRSVLVGEDFARHILGYFAFSPGVGWMVWDGRRWATLGAEGEALVTKESHIWAQAWISSIVTLGAAKDVIKASCRYLEYAQCEHLVKTARVQPGILIPAGDLDRHPDLLNVANGVVDLRTGQLLGHDPALWLTKITETKYVPGLVHTDWSSALAALEPDVQEYLRVRFGQAATGHAADDDVLPFFVGVGGNGKSTIIKAVHHALGDHSTFISDRVLMATTGAHPTELTDLRGARLAFIEEMPTTDGRRLNVQRLKTLQGTAIITARKMRQDSISFEPSHSIFTTCNTLPRVVETDQGTWRRLVAVLFEKRFGQSTASSEAGLPEDRGLRSRLGRGESGSDQAVLAWVVSGSMDWYRLGKTLPEAPLAVQNATRMWRHDNDLIARFIEERLTFAGSWRTNGWPLPASRSRRSAWVEAPPRCGASPASSSLPVAGTSPRGRYLTVTPATPATPAPEHDPVSPRGQVRPVHLRHR